MYLAHMFSVFFLYIHPCKCSITHIIRHIGFSLLSRSFFLCSSPYFRVLLAPLLSLLTLIFTVLSVLCSLLKAHSIIFFKAFFHHRLISSNLLNLCALLSRAPSSSSRRFSITVLAESYYGIRALHLKSSAG